MPQQPERTGIPPTASVAGRRAVVTEAKRGDPRVYKILKTRCLNLAQPGKNTHQHHHTPPPPPHPPPRPVHALPGRAFAAADPPRGLGRRARARSAVQVSKHSRQRGLPARPAVPRRAPAAGRAGEGAGRAPGMRVPRNKWAPRRRRGEGSEGRELRQ